MNLSYEAKSDSLGVLFIQTRILTFQFINKKGGMHDQRLWLVRILQIFKAITRFKSTC